MTYAPTPLQKYAEIVELRDGPLLFIIEDMTGAGKTEAAVILAHRLMHAGKAQGLHIALPTMATANAMFARMAKNYRRMFTDEVLPSIVLTHGRRDLFESFTHLTEAAAKYDGGAQDEDDPSNIEASAFCADWIARSNKQAFLAQVGAGTIDQAILAVLPARHQSLRLWGLAGKVLVIDEAHAYDAYMNEEIESLLTSMQRLAVQPSFCQQHCLGTSVQSWSMLFWRARAMESERSGSLCRALIHS